MTNLLLIKNKLNRISLKEKNNKKIGNQTFYDMIKLQGKWAELHFSVAAGTAEQRYQKLLNRWVAR